MQLGPSAWGEHRGTSWTSNMDVWKALEFYGHLQADHESVKARMKAEADQLEVWANEHQELLAHVFRVPEPPPWDGKTFPPADTPTNGGTTNE